MRLIFRQIPGAIWATDRDLRITYAQGTLPFTDLPVRGVVRMTVAELTESNDPTGTAIGAHARALSGEPCSFCTQHAGRWLDVRIEPLRADDDAIVGCVGVAVDTTEHRRVEQELARNRRRMEEAQRFAHVGSFEWELSTDKMTWSDELYRIYAIEPASFDGTSAAFFERVHANDVDRTKATIFDALRELRPFCYEHRIARPDGSVRTLQTRGDIVTDTDSRPQRLVGSCWDVTDATESLATQRRALSLVDATINATAEGVLVVAPDGKITASNQRFFDLWRIPQDLGRQRSDSALLTFVVNELEDPDAFMREVRALYGRPTKSSFDTLRFKDGRVFERTSLPQRIGDEIVGRVWSFRDVTEREHRLKRALFLADATRLLASLDVEAALEAVARLAVPVIADVCAIDLVDERGGPRRLQLISRGGKAAEVELPPSVLAGQPARFSSAGGGAGVSVPLVVKGEVVGALTFVAAPDVHYGDVDIALATEIAQRAALSVENARLYRSAQDALRARDELLAVAAHEIRGPLTSMQIAAQALSRSLPQNAPDARRLVDIIQRDDRRLARFVDELLDVGRFRGGQLRFDIQSLDLRSIVFEVAARFAADIERAGSSLTISADANVVGEWDAFRLDQVVSNLLANAIKFGAGKPVLISVQAIEDKAVLIVKDQGIGIAHDALLRIFAPFERAVSIRHYGGLGLGLHIVKVIVEGLKGSVRVDSHPGAGSTFTVELPRKRST